MLHPGTAPELDEGGARGDRVLPALGASGTRRFRHPALPSLGRFRHSALPSLGASSTRVRPFVLRGCLRAEGAVGREGKAEFTQHPRLDRSKPSSYKRGAFGCQYGTQEGSWWNSSAVPPL